MDFSNGIDYAKQGATVKPTAGKTQVAVVNSEMNSKRLSEKWTSHFNLGAAETDRGQPKARDMRTSDVKSSKRQSVEKIQRNLPQCPM